MSALGLLSNSLPVYCRRRSQCLSSWRWLEPLPLPLPLLLLLPPLLQVSLRPRALSCVMSDVCAARGNGALASLARCHRSRVSYLPTTALTRPGTSGARSGLRVVLSGSAVAVVMALVGCGQQNNMTNELAHCLACRQMRCALGPFEGKRRSRCSRRLWRTYARLLALDRWRNSPSS